MLLRILRGVLGTALLWAVVWLPVGAAFGLLLNAGQRGNVIPPSVLWMVTMGGAWGGVSGVIFAGLLALAERRHTIADLSLIRVAAWGAVGCASLPVLLALHYLPREDLLALRADAMFLGIVLVVSALLGAACAAGTLTLARRAPGS
jgi:hypothetical protein